MSKMLNTVMVLVMIFGMVASVSVSAQRPAAPAERPAPAVNTHLTYAVSEVTQPAAPQAPTIAPGDVVTFTILHTNDFHGKLEYNAAEAYPGIARVATVISTTRAAIGADNTLLLDAGDMMQGSLLSNMYYGESTIDLYSFMGYDAATLGNHEFDWSQQILISRTLEAAFPFVAANVVSNTTGSCATVTGWDHPSWVRPWYTLTVGTAPKQAVVGIIGVSSQETPYITKVENTAGLCFQDPANSIVHYYDEVKAAGADVIVVITHIGYTDGGYGYGISVYGDQTLAKKLVEAGKYVPLIIGGHSHTDMTRLSPAAPNGTVVSGTLVVQASTNGLQVGRASITVTLGVTTTPVSWQVLPVSTGAAEDAATLARVNTWKTAQYLEKVGQVLGYTAVDIRRDRFGDSLMGNFVDDALYNELNNDADPNNDVDIVVNNSGGIRADINMTNTISNGSVNVYTITYGAMFDVLPFGNQVVTGTMTGAQIWELLNQSASNCPAGCTARSVVQAAGLRYTFFAYTDTLPSPAPQPWAWGAISATVRNRSTGLWEPLLMTQTYRIATNEFLAPAGQDGFFAFKYFKNLAYLNQDMLDVANRWISATHTFTNPYSETLDGRITRIGTTTYDPSNPNLVVPVVILHHNDPHGRLVDYVSSGVTYPGYTRLATIINRERGRNPSRTILLNAGDTIQGDSMMYYFRTAPLGHASDGTTLPVTMTTQPMIAAMNAMTYTAMTLGNHEFNFGSSVFTNVLRQANFPILQANLSDDGRYGLSQVPVQPYATVSLPGSAGTIKVAVLGIGNHRVPYYELPSNIAGLTFSDPISEAQARAPTLQVLYDAVVALTHIGFTVNPSSVEVDDKVDTTLAAQTVGLDTIIGGHSHTNPDMNRTDTSRGSYKYLPATVGGPGNTPVAVSQAYRYNNYLGVVVLGLLPNPGGGYTVVSRAGRYIAISTSTAEDSRIRAIVDPYLNLLNSYNGQQLGQTTAPVDALPAFTQETNAANLQNDASVWELAQHGITVDFHLSGAMTNQRIAASATAATPYTLTIADMFTLMPYENSLVAMQMNGPQLKAILERAYRNYYYYKYVPGYGGYSYYTTCMLDINSGGEIVYKDTYPNLPDGNNVAALIVNGQPVNFLDAATYYTVSTVNYLAAGSCNFSDAGVTLWPLAQVTNDTQYYVRDAVIDYVRAQGTITPAVEGRLVFLNQQIFMPIVFK